MNNFSMLDPNQIMQEVHNESEKTLDVITANSLVPKRFGKVALEYITSGNGIGEVGAARYYSDGAYQKQTITAHGDYLGSAHKTLANFYNRTPQNLANTYFTVYDSAGPVTIWFDLNNTGLAPTTGYRLIEVDISAGDTEQQLAQKLNAKINTDSTFFSVINDVMVMIVNLVVGVRTDSKDNNSGLVIKNIQGVNKSRLDGVFFYLNSALNATSYYVWFNVNNSSLNPTVSGKTGIQVNITEGCSAQDVVIAMKIALEGNENFLTNIDEDRITILNQVIGTTTPIQDVSCNFTITRDVLGSSRNLIAHLIMTYNTSNNLESVERL